jgi:imidazolonepropionase-like amidohydrolase
MSLLPSLILAAASRPQATFERPDLALTHVNVVDVEHGALLRDRTVLVRGDRIAWLGPAAEASLAEGATVVECKGQYVIPGLWDMHVHLPSKQDERASLPLFIAHGVTGVREMGSDCPEGSEPERPGLAGLRGWRARIERGELIGPRLLALSTWPVSGRWSGSDARAEADAYVRRGVDFVKVLETLPAPAYFDLVAAATERGLPVAGHVPLAVGMIEAARAGQASIEHARDFVFEGFPGSDEFRRTAEGQDPPTPMLRRMVDEHDPARVRAIARVLAEHGTRYCPTHLTRRFDARADDPDLRADPRLAYVLQARADEWDEEAEQVIARDPSPAGRAVLEDVHRVGLADTRIAREAGVELLAGTDANDSYVFPGSSLHEELEELASAGLSPAEALRAATLAGARFLGRSSDFGTVEVGKKADLVLLREDPLADVSHTRSIEAVVFDGRPFARAEIDALLRGVREFVAEQGREPEVPVEALERCTGTYAGPQGELCLSREGRALYLRPPGRGRMRLRARSETEFVHLPDGMRVTFRVEVGGVTSLEIERGGRSATARRVE